MTYSLDHNPIARELGIPVPLDGYLEVRRRADQRLVAVARYMPSRDGIDPCETLYACAGWGSTPNNPGHAARPGANRDILTGFRRRFLGGRPVEDFFYSLSPCPTPGAMSAAEIEFRAQA